MKYWGIIADKLHAAGWSWGYCRALTCDGWRWIVDAHKGDGRWYIIESDELLRGFLELEAARPAFAKATKLRQKFSRIIRPRVRDICDETA